MCVHMCAHTGKVQGVILELVILMLAILNIKLMDTYSTQSAAHKTGTPKKLYLKCKEFDLIKCRALCQGGPVEQPTSPWLAPRGELH